MNLTVKGSLLELNVGRWDLVTNESKFGLAGDRLKPPKENFSGDFNESHIYCEIVPTEGNVTNSPMSAFAEVPHMDVCTKVLGILNEAHSRSANEQSLLVFGLGSVVSQLEIYYWLDRSVKNVSIFSKNCTRK